MNHVPLEIILEEYLSFCLQAFTEFISFALTLRPLKRRALRA